MTPQRRNAIVRWTLTALVLAVAGAMLWDYPWLEAPLTTGLMVVSVALIASLGLPISYGTMTFMPVAALMAYLALGPEHAWLALVVGMALGGMAGLPAEQTESTQPDWWVRLAGRVWPIAHNGLSLLIAAWSYRELGGQVPLVNVPTLPDVLPVIAFPVMYLLVYAALLALDVWLAGYSVLRYAISNRQVLLAVTLLPMPMAPLAAIALNQLGLPAFTLLLASLLSVVMAVNRLAIAQANLRLRVRQLSSLSSVGQAVRTSLELEALLEVIYLQVASSLRVRDFAVALFDQDAGVVYFPFAVRNSRRERIPPRKGHNSPIEWVIEHGRSLLIEQDVALALDRMSLSQPEGQPRSWMGVPLLGTDRALGCMAAWLPTDDPEKRIFTAEDLELFNNVAIQAGVAVENALLYQDAQRHAAQLTTLSRTSAAMSASLDPQRVLELVSQSAIKVAGCAKSVLYLLDDDEDPPSLRLSHAHGLSQTGAERLKAMDAPLSKTERAAVLEEGRMVSVPDISTLSGQIAPALSVLVESEGVRAYAYLPLSLQNEPIGLLGVYYDQPHRFGSSEIELLETFANQAAMAVANARVFQRVDVELTRRVDQIVMLADINRQLSATLDLEKIGDLLVESAMQACGASAALLVLIEESGRRLNMLAWRGYSPTDPKRAPHIVARELADRVVTSGQAYLEPDLGGDGGGQTPRMRSQLSVPIAVEDNTIGAIALESTRPNAFSEEDVAFVSQLAGQAAIAIQNAELYRHASEVGDRLHAVLDASLDGFLMIDAKSRIVMTNTRMSDFWDFAREDFGTRSPEEFLADPLTALGEGLGYRTGELGELMERAQRNPDMPPQEDLYVTKAGGTRQRFVVRMASPVHDEQRNFLGLLLIFRDVTEQKKLEEARETLTGMIVHDLRGPLTAILGSIRLVEEMVPDMQSVVRQALSASDRAIKRLLNLVSTLLDLYRLEDEDLTLDLAPEALQPVLESASLQLSPLALELEVEVDVEASPDLPEAYMDRDLIERVMQNLLDNALKFTQPRRAVKMRAEVIPTSPDPRAPGSRHRPVSTWPIHRDRMLLVQVIDSGPGVPEDYRERIFDRFSQVHGQTGRRRGTGLGLAFCRLAVEAHGGAIWIEDNPQGGSIFQFTLPISAAPPEATE
jgi:NtrC-family two-component system sensor histidine kinase KinB